jgi:hypothetical protein
VLPASEKKMEFENRKTFRVVTLTVLKTHNI